MSLESGTFIRDLDESNPPGTDKKKQGDDHLRLIKKVVRGTLPNSSKAFMFPGSAVKTADFSIAGPGVSGTDTANAMNVLFLVDTTSTVITATLPTLTATDAGWECSFIKTNVGLNPLFIAPPTGTIQSGEVSGLSKTRRCIPGRRTRVIWTGSAWIAERVVMQPIGSVVDLGLALTLPVGYEWPDGVALSSAANYPEYNAVLGGLGKPDRRGRAVFGRDNMGVGPASRLGVIIGGTGVGNAAGAETVTLDSTMVPGTGVSGSCSVTSLTGSGTISGSVTVVSNSGGSGSSSGVATANSQGGTGTVGGSISAGATCSVTSGSGSGTISGTVSGGGLLHSNLPPAVIANFAVVVE